MEKRRKSSCCHVKVFFVFVHAVLWLFKYKKLIFFSEEVRKGGRPLSLRMSPSLFFTEPADFFSNKFIESN